MFESLIVLKEIYKNVNFLKEMSRRQKCMQNFPACKINPYSAIYNLQQTTILNCAAFSKITCIRQAILMKYHILVVRKL